MYSHMTRHIKRDKRQNLSSRKYCTGVLGIISPGRQEGGGHKRSGASTKRRETISDLITKCAEFLAHTANLLQFIASANLSSCFKNYCLRRH